MVKVSDFGLTKHIEQKTKRDVKRKDKPIRWMSLESLQQNIFPIESEVVCKLLNIS